MGYRTISDLSLIHISRRRIQLDTTERCAIGDRSRRRPRERWRCFVDDDGRRHLGSCQVVSVAGLSRLDGAEAKTHRRDGHAGRGADGGSG